MQTNSPTLAIAEWSCDRLKPDPRNPRTHAPSQIRQIVASIRQFGWTNPILVDPEGIIIAGEARWMAARELRLPTVPVIVLAHLSAQQKLAYRIADNRIPLNAGWDEALLASVLAELQAVEFDLPTLGFSDEEIAQLLDSLAEPPHPLAADDVAPPPPPAPVTRLGDVWQLGDHRLICGDSTKRETLEGLMAAGADLVFTDPPYGMSYDGGRARKASMVFTDPPYGMDYESNHREVKHAADLVFTDPPYGMSFGKGKEAGSTAKGALVKAHGMILGDDAKGEDLVNLVAEALKRAAEFTRPGAAFYVCFTWRTYREFLEAVEGAGLGVAGCIVWNKGSIGLGFQHYRPQHEFIFYCQGDRWYGGRTQADVWTFSRGNLEGYVHPTQKPVELVAKALENSSLPGDVVLDLFGGSGSTMIACEKTRRAARVVELDPKYCDVQVRRWQDFTGREATLAATTTENGGSAAIGRTFARILEERT